jgi:hypothetical protein
MSEVLVNLRVCSRCHSTVLTEYFEKNRKGQWFRTCNSCRDKKKKEWAKAKNKKQHETDSPLNENPDITSQTHHDNNT